MAEDSSRRYDVIVVGAGAAGLMCAIEAGRRGRRVLLLEGSDGPGKKILISGGGRCNFTNLYASPENYLSSNPHFCKSALSRYTPGDFIALVESHGIKYHEKKLGQLFCDGNARAILAMLETEASDAGVEVLPCVIRAVDKGETGFVLETDQGVVEAESLVVATGGLSIPKMGATDFGYRLARHFDIGIVEPRPGLVPLTFSGAMQQFCAGLSGVSLDVTASCNGQFFRENLLFTHDGLSGPAILQISSYWLPGQAISLDMLPGRDALNLLTDAAAAHRALGSMLADHWPRRVAQGWAEAFGPSRPLDQLTAREIEALATLLHAWELRPMGTRGYAKAEVTVGGIDTNELSQRTMESRKVPGLYFIGEVVDVTGWLGGYNFQWAWASGYAAGQAV